MIITPSKIFNNGELKLLTQLLQFLFFSIFLMTFSLLGSKHDYALFQAGLHGNAIKE